MRERRQLSLAEVPPGTELADPVNDEDGILLVAGGTRLQGRQLEQLLRRGVERVTVWIDSGLPPEEIAKRRKALEAQVLHRFRRAAERPLMKELAERLVRYRLERGES